MRQSQLVVGNCTTSDIQSRPIEGLPHKGGMLKEEERVVGMSGLWKTAKSFDSQASLPRSMQERQSSRRNAAFDQL